MKKIAGVYVVPADVSALDYGHSEGPGGDDRAHPIFILKSGVHLVGNMNEPFEAAEMMLENIFRELWVLG